MSPIEFLLLAAAIFVAIILFKRYHSKHPTDLEFNLNDPKSMTQEERSEQVNLLIRRANELCGHDRVPGRYIRIGEQKYAELVEKDKTIDRTKH